MGEGTTTVAINTALALAAKGYRTNFVDCDFSKSASKQIHRMVEHKNLHVVRAEKKTDYKADIEKWKENYEFIILDGSPILVTEDVASWTAHADATIFVMKADHLSIDKLTDALESFNQLTDNLMGAVLNGSKHQMSRYGYGYGYGHRYVQRENK